MTKYTLIQEDSKISKKGDQRIIVVQKKHHKTLEEKGLLNRDLKITMIFETISS